MMPRLPVSSMPQYKSNRHDGACLEFFQPIEHFEPTFLEAYEASNMICKVRSFKSRIKTHSLLDDIITSSNKVLKDA